METTAVDWDNKTTKRGARQASGFERSRRRFENTGGVDVAAKGPYSQLSQLSVSNQTARLQGYKLHCKTEVRLQDCKTTLTYIDRMLFLRAHTPHSPGPKGRADAQSIHLKRKPIF